MTALSLASDEDAGGGRDPVKTISNKISSFKDRLITPEAAAAQIETVVSAASRRGDPTGGQVFRSAAKVRRSSRTSPRMRKRTGKAPAIALGIPHLSHEKAAALRALSHRTRSF